MLILVAHPYDETIEAEISGPPYPFGDDLDLDGGMTFSLFGAETTVYMADDDYVSAPTDVPPNTYMPAVLLNPFNYQELMFEGMEPDGRARGGFGDIRIWNGAARDDVGWLDDKLHLGWDGRDLIIYRGQKDAAFSTFELVAKLTCDGLEWDEHTVSLRLRNGVGVFDQTLARQRYDGTGGAAGDANLASVWKPLTLGGGPINVSPVLFDAEHLIYQYHHNTPTLLLEQSVDLEVRDKGVALAITGNTAGDYASLVAHVVGAGEYKLTTAISMFRLGSTPAGRITADFGYGYGHAASFNRVGLASTVFTLVSEYMDVKFRATQTDWVGLHQLDDDYPYRIGYYIRSDEEPTAGEILDRLMGSARGYWGVRLDGKFFAGLLKAPSGTADYTIDASEIVGPIRRRHYMPSRSRRIGYDRNWTIQSGDDLASGVSAEDRARYGALYLYAATEDSLVRGAHPNARDVTVDSYLTGADSASNAEAEATRQQELFGAERDFYELDIIGDPFAYEMGGLVDITGVTRFGWSDPKQLRIIGRAVDDPRDGFEAPITLTLWG